MPKMMLIISKIKHSHYVIHTQYTVTQVKSETSGNLTNGVYMNKINVYFVIIHTLLLYSHVQL